LKNTTAKVDVPQNITSTQNLDAGAEITFVS
jgi:hypothetical protein